MANTLLSVLRKPLPLSFWSRANNIGLASINAQDVKHLYSKSTLGLDGFEQQRERVKNQMANISDKFREKMSEYVIHESKNMIFTEDLKNMIHIADSDKDIELAIEMLKRYNKQNKSLRFGNYIFGPVVMRMLYIHNKADLALECFKSEELSGLFDQYISFQILLDLLLENKKYKELLETSEIIFDKQLEGQKYPKNIVVLVLAACFKLNTQESLDYALKLWQDLTAVGHQPMRRATTFCAGLALNQGKPEIALEILTTARNQNYTTVRNLRVAALAEIGRIEDIIPLLKSVLNEDLVQGQGQIHTFNRDVIERVKKVVSASDNAEITLEFNRLEQMFEKQGHLSNISLNDQLCAEIQRPPVLGSRDFNRQQQDFQQRGQYDNYNRGYQQRPRFNRNQQRPGLKDLV